MSQTDKIVVQPEPVVIMGVRMVGRKRLLAELPHLKGFQLVRKQCVEFEGKLWDYQSQFYPTADHLVVQGWPMIVDLGDGRGLLARELDGNMVQLAIITREDEQ